MKIGNSITNPGELNVKTAVKKRTVSTDAGGFQTEILRTVVDPWWVKWTGVHGSEAWAAGTTKAQRAATVLGRYHADIDETCEVVLDNEFYEINSMDDIGQRHEYLELKVKLAKPG